MNGYIPLEHTLNRERFLGESLRINEDPIEMVAKNDIRAGMFNRNMSVAPVHNIALGDKDTRFVAPYTNVTQPVRLLSNPSLVETESRLRRPGKLSW